MANMIAENTATLVRLVLKHRPRTFVTLEQPKGSRLFKLPSVASLMKDCQMFCILTYLGLFGMQILKATWLYSNWTSLHGVGRRATKVVKDKFTKRTHAMHERLKAQGKPVPIFYTIGVSKRTGKKTFTGGPNLGDTSKYPTRFCTAVFKLWNEANALATRDNL